MTAKKAGRERSVRDAASSHQHRLNGSTKWTVPIRRRTAHKEIRNIAFEILVILPRRVEIRVKQPHHTMLQVVG